MKLKYWDSIYTQAVRQVHIYFWMLEELHVHKVEYMYHMYVLGITGDCDGHAVASEANWKWGGLDI